MRNFVIALLLAIVSAPAIAGETIAFGNRVLTTGDSTGRIMEVAGSPDRVVQLENRFGAATGERWEYYQGGKTIVLTIVNSRLVRIEEIR